MKKRDIISLDWDMIIGFGDRKRFTCTRCTEVDAEFCVEVQELKRYRNFMGEWEEWKVVECGYSSSKDEIFDYIDFVVKGVVKYVENSKNTYKEIKTLGEIDADFVKQHYNIKD